MIFKKKSLFKRRQILIQRTLNKKKIEKLIKKKSLLNKTQILIQRNLNNKKIKKLIKKNSLKKQKTKNKKKKIQDFFIQL